MYNFVDRVVFDLYTRIFDEFGYKKQDPRFTLRMGVHAWTVFQTSEVPASRRKFEAGKYGEEEIVTISGPVTLVRDYDLEPRQMQLEVTWDI
jgi:hypothetical protein